MKLSNDELTWDPASESFTAQLSFCLESTNLHNLAERLLPVPLQIFANSEPELQIDRKKLEIKHVGRGNWEDVKLLCKPGTKRSSIEVLSDLGNKTLNLACEPLRIHDQIDRFMEAPILVITLLTGGFAGWLRSLKTRRMTPKRRVVLISEGMFVGLIFVAAARANFHIGGLDSSMASKFGGAFVIAGATGYAGAHLLEKLNSLILGVEK
jgi:hypothetical protein